MTDRFTPDSWDEELDRQLRDALSVAPSPAFRSRVRARLDAEAVPSPFGGMVSMMAAAAAIAVVVVAGTMSSRWWNLQSAPSQLASRPGVFAAVPYAAPIASRTAAVVTVPFGREEVTVRSGNVIDGASPERIVTAQFAPEERAAFRLFVRLARTGELPVPESLPFAGDGGDTLPAIEIPPIEILPVIVDAGPQAGLKTRPATGEGVSQ